MNTALSNFRDIVQLLHRVVRPDALHSRDLHTLVDKIHDSLSGRDDCCSPVRVEAFPYHELLRPPTPPTLVIHPEQDAGEIVPNVIVTKDEPEIRNVVVQVSKPTPILGPMTTTPSLEKAILGDLARDDDDSEIEPVDDTPTATSDVESDSDSESESDNDEDDADEDDADEDDADEEEEAEEDDDLELKMIKKQRYYWSPSSRRIYECLEEGYGDCLGTYDGSKIIPKA